MPAQPLLNPATDRDAAPLGVALLSSRLLADDAAQQNKRCTACQRPLALGSAPADVPPFTLSHESSENASFCGACREVRLRQQQQQQQQQMDEQPRMRSVRRRTGSLTVLSDVPMIPITQDGELDKRERAPAPTPSAISTTRSSAFPIPILHPESQQIGHLPPRDDSPVRYSPSVSPAHSHSPYAPGSGQQGERRYGYGNKRAAQPDPFVDITRLRVRSRGYKSLYPGATFKGSQKSGRNSYDVTVTIIDVDFPTSTACGYLRICGLTDDWPELTTYFDAQIIGPTHGFDTQAEWGAARADDLVHWARFPAFHALQARGVLREPRLTLPAAEVGRGAVFMRWKERFLVPDHSVRDLTGASFAGFYYVCVDFEPKADPIAPVEANLVGEGESPQATMCGFYYHQHSEPYQQLSLTHVKDQFRRSFEFR